MTKYLRIQVAGLPIVHTPEHRGAAEAMAEAVEATVELLSERWNLKVPGGCELHVLTDWAEFIDQTAPGLFRYLVKLTKPLWQTRAERAFKLAGGWSLPWKGRPAVGVKPPELLPNSETSLGARLFVRVEDPMEKVRHFTCHELTHAFTAHLRLPPWLNEGLAMRAVDHMVERPTVLDETRALVEQDPSTLGTRSYRRLAARDHDALIRFYATGYWITRQIDENDPSELARILETRRPQPEVARAVMTASQPS